jgi:predicted metal-dependent hydrolase
VTVLRVGDLAVEIRRSARRRSVGLTVERDGRIVLASPQGVAEERLAKFLREKQFWIYTKLAERATKGRAIGVKEFVSGESFGYLGRTYRLLLVDRQEAVLSLRDGRFRLQRSEARRGREHFIRWYTEHGTPWIARRIKHWAERMRVEPKGVAVRDLGYRWGSCGHARLVNFHWATMLLPPSIVDYVIVHELAHLAVPNHGPAFWRKVGLALPEYESRKSWLASHGGQQVLA